MKKTISKRKLTLQRDQIRVLNPDTLIVVSGGRIATLYCDRTGSTDQCSNNTGKLATCN